MRKMPTMSQDFMRGDQYRIKEHSYGRNQIPPETQKIIDDIRDYLLEHNPSTRIQVMKALKLTPQEVDNAMKNGTKYVLFWEDEGQLGILAG